MSTPCRKCGSGNRNASGKCRPCMKRRHVEWCKRNPGEDARRSANWYAENKGGLDPVRLRKNLRNCRAAKKARGECSQCPNPAVPDKTRCASHAAKHSADTVRHLSKDLGARLAMVVRARLTGAIKNGQRAGSAVRDLGCSIDELKKYLEVRFKPGMTWENWSRTGWHIDHIKPLASFDLTDHTQFLQVCHYMNLQPLWAEENFAKNRKVA